MIPKTVPKTPQKVIQKLVLKKDTEVIPGRKICIKILEGLLALSEAPAAYIPTSFELSLAFTP